MSVKCAHGTRVLVIILLMLTLAPFGPAGAEEVVRGNKGAPPRPSQPEPKNTALPLPELDGRLARYFEMRRAAGAFVAPLEVPYYSQGSSEWCWATSLAMVGGYHGFSDRVWEIAAPFNIAIDGKKFIYSDLADYLKDKHQAFAEYTYFVGVEALNGYLMEALERNTPVWLGIPAASHAIVAVGYDKDRIYIHDPSGKFIGLAEEFKGPESEWRRILQGKLAAHGILWERWEKTLRALRQDDSWRTWLAQGMRQSATVLAIVSPVSPRAKPLSIQITPSDNDPNRRSVEISHFLRNAHTGDISPTVNVDFEWTGKKPGVRFRHNLADIRLNRTAACNDDRILGFQAYVSNTSRRKRSVTVQVRLDGILLGSAEGSVEAKTSHLPFTIKRADFLRAFDREQVTPGIHKLTFELWSGKELADSEVVDFPVAPAEVKKVTVRQVDAGHFRATWQSNPEPGVKYRVITTPGQNLSRMRTIGTTGATQLTMKLRPEDTKELGQYFSVWASDAASGLWSQNANFVKVEMMQTPPREVAPPRPASPDRDGPDPVVQMTPEQQEELHRLSFGISGKTIPPTDASNYARRLSLIRAAFRSFKPVDRTALFGDDSWAQTEKTIAQIGKNDGPAAQHRMVDNLLVRMQSTFH